MHERGLLVILTFNHKSASDHYNHRLEKSFSFVVLFCDAKTKITQPLCILVFVGLKSVCSPTSFPILRQLKNSTVNVR